MTVQADFELESFADCNVTIALAPPSPISGWTIRFDAYKYPGGSPVVSKFLASGFVNTSGISLVDGSQGSFQVSLLVSDFSGQVVGNYYYQARRTDTGSNVGISAGYIIMPR